VWKKKPLEGSFELGKSRSREGLVLCGTSPSSQKRPRDSRYNRGIVEKEERLVLGPIDNGHRLKKSLRGGKGGKDLGGASKGRKTMHENFKR